MPSVAATLAFGLPLVARSVVGQVTAGPFLSSSPSFPLSTLSIPTPPLRSCEWAGHLLLEQSGREGEGLALLA